MKKNTTIKKVTGPMEDEKLTVNTVKVDNQIIVDLDKQLKNVRRYTTATFNAWVKIGNSLAAIKEACNGDTKLFGMYLTKLENAKSIPVIGKDNRASSMMISNWIENGFEKEKNIDLSFEQWRIKHAGNKSSPNTLVKAVNAFVKAEAKIKAIADDKAKTEALPYPEHKPATSEPTTNEPATSEPATDLDKLEITKPVKARYEPDMIEVSKLNNNELLELFGLVQAELLSRVATEQIKSADLWDFKRITNALNAVLNSGDAVSVNTKESRWTNAI